MPTLKDNLPANSEIKTGFRTSSNNQPSHKLIQMNKWQVL